MAVISGDPLSVGTFRERSTLLSKPVLIIEIEDGVIAGARVSSESPQPDVTPRLLVREFQSDGSLERARVTGTDASGREYYEHEIGYLDKN